MRLTAQLKTIITLWVISIVIALGLGAWTYHALSPKPNVEIVVQEVETKVPDVHLELSDTKPAQKIPDLGELPDVGLEKIENDSIYHTQFTIDREQYFGGLDVYFSILQKVHSYNLDITVKNDPIYIEVPVEITTHEIVENDIAWLYKYVEFGVGYDFGVLTEEEKRNDSFTPDFGTLGLGVAIKKTIPIYVEFNTLGLISIKAGILFR